MNAEELLRRYAAGERNFSGLSDDIDLSGVVLTGVNLSEANLNCVGMSGANLSEANLRKSDLSDIDLTGANLNGANLCEANLNCAYLSTAKFKAADLSDANLENADLTGADLSQANLCNANLNSAHLESADLRGADLRGADLESIRYDESTQFPEEFNPSSYKGFWLGNDTFIKCDQLTNVRIAKSWDNFSDAIRDMGYVEQIEEILESGYRGCYSFRDVPIKLSDLIGLDWDSMEINGTGIYEKLAFSRNIMYQLEDAIYTREVELILFLYT